MARDYYVYILASRKGRALYTGVTNDLVRRVWQHRNGFGSEHAAQYCIDKLVYFEVFSDPVSAIEREKKLKKWLREWKVALIEKENPEWRDLYPDIAV